MSVNQFKIAVKNSVTADAGDGVCELYFLDTIANPTYYNWESEQSEEVSLLACVIQQVKSYSPSKIVLCIDSVGGSASVGFGIYNFLKNYPAKVECKIMGMCGSIATIIACAANKGKVTMARNGFYIIHEASSIGVGRASDLIAEAKVTEMYTQQMCDVYANRSGTTSAEQFREMIAPGDCWLNAEQAIALGLVDDTFNKPDVTVTAMIRAAQTANINIPANVLALQENPEPIIEQPKTIPMTLKNFVTAAIDKIRGKKVDTTNDITAQIGDAIGEPLAEMVTSIQDQVTAEINGIEGKVTATVTAAIETRYGKLIADLSTENAALKTETTALTARVTTLTSDVIALVGGQSGTGGKAPKADKSTGGRSFMDPVE